MFGKPAWFFPKSFGWGLHPITWQGWAYSIGWVAVIAVPFVILLTREQAGGGLKVAEACIWLAASLGAMIYDVRLILRQLRGTNDSPPVVTAKAVDDVLYIGDDSSPVATRNYQLRRKG